MRSPTSARDKCSVARHHQAKSLCVCVCVKCSCSATSLYSRNGLRHPAFLQFGQRPLERERKRAKAANGEGGEETCAAMFTLHGFIITVSVTANTILHDGQPSSRVPRAVGPRT